jgi:hypothetical protein
MFSAFFSGRQTNQFENLEKPEISRELSDEELAGVQGGTREGTGGTGDTTPTYAIPYDVYVVSVLVSIFAASKK